jgi:hypothetical protein
VSLIAPGYDGLQKRRTMPLLLFLLNKRLRCFCFLLEHGEMEKQYQTKYPSDVSDEEWAFAARI